MTRPMPTGPAVIVDPYSSGAMFAPSFQDAGVPVVAVTTAAEPPEVYAASYRPEDFTEIITFEGELGWVIDRLRQLAPRCVIAGCESGVELADALAPAVVPKLANDPSRASARRHKGEMAAAVAASGLPIIKQICTADVEEVAAWIEREGLAGRDLVVKPPKSASTDGVVKIHGGDGWRPVFESMIGRHNRLGILNDRLLVQQYAHGVEYVIDMFTHDGVHTVTDVCRYHKVSNGPHMAVYDTMRWLPPDAPDLDRLVEYASGVLDAVGLRFGAAHVELMLTADGPRLIEIGARPHGGGHPRFCRVANGDSQIDRTVRYLTTQEPIPARYELISPTLVAFHIAQSAGMVSNAEVLEDINDLPSHLFSVRHVRNGDHIPMTSDLFSSLDFGFAVFSSVDGAQVDADYAEFRTIESKLLIE